LGSFLGDLEALPQRNDRLVPFGDLGSLTSPQVLLDQSLDALARATHEVYLANVHDASAASAPWALLPERFKQSNRAFADHIPVKLAQIGLRLTSGGAVQETLGTDEIERLAQMEHWRWSLEQYLLGWRPGPKRDDFLKQHSLLVDWAELPEDAKDINRELVSRIPAILGAAGLCALRGERENA
jgi:hypothetical protein